MFVLKWERMLFFFIVVKSIVNYNLSVILMLYKCYFVVYVLYKQQIRFKFILLF